MAEQSTGSATEDTGDSGGSDTVEEAPVMRRWERRPSRDDRLGVYISGGNQSKPPQASGSRPPDQHASIDRSSFAGSETRNTRQKDDRKSGIGIGGDSNGENERLKANTNLGNASLDDGKLALKSDAELELSEANFDPDQNTGVTQEGGDKLTTPKSLQPSGGDRRSKLSECFNEEETPGASPPLSAAVQAISGHPFPETEPPSSDKALKLYRRDQLLCLLRDLDLELDERQPVENVELCLPEVSGVENTYESLNSGAEESFQEYGRSTNFKPGSIVMVLQIKSKQQLDKLCEDLLSGAFLDKTKKHVEDALVQQGYNADEVGILWSVKYPKHQIQALREFFDAEYLEDMVDFTHCAGTGAWYWSPDQENWFSTAVSMVTTGKYQGRKPQEEDLKVIGTLQANNVVPPGLVNPEHCFICNLRKMNSSNVVDQRQWFDLNVKLIITAVNEESSMNKGAVVSNVRREFELMEKDYAVLRTALKTFQEAVEQERATLHICQQIDKFLKTYTKLTATERGTKCISDI